MIGALIGDIIGSTYEKKNTKSFDFELFPEGSRFTDDSVLSLAIADKILHSSVSGKSSREAYAEWFKLYFRRYSSAGFGQSFYKWGYADKLYIQRSYGNGSAMRVTPIGLAYDSIKEIIREIKYSCYYTHHNREAICGAKAIAIAVFLAKKQCDKDEIKRYIEKECHYKFKTLDEIRDSYVFEVRAGRSVPQAIEAFLESESYEDAIRKAISIGGDSDTIACMAGGIAEAYYRKIPEEIYTKGLSYLDLELRKIVVEFDEKFL